MSTYQRPLQPWDPITPDQQPKPPIRYIRDNFQGTGQDSHTQAPAQDASMWQALTNIQPIARGVVQRRWGYKPFAATSNSPNRLANFQSDSTGVRAIIAASPLGVAAFDETGLSYNPSIFAPQGPGIIRSITSRNYQYFCNGNNAEDGAFRSGDSLKWDGSAGGGVTNIGISATDVTTNGTGGGTSGNVAGPATGASASDIAYSTPNAWTAPSGIFTNSFVAPASNTLSETITVTQSPPGVFPTTYATTYSNVKTRSDTLQALNFFNSVNGTAVAGLQIALTYKVTVSGTNINTANATYATLRLVKNGVLTGTQKTITLISDGASHTVVLGSASDLWGTSFAPVDLVQANFGLQLYAGAAFVLTNDTLAGTYNAAAAVKFSYVTVTATLTGGAGTSASSGVGVGVVSAVAGGAVNLTIGRTYYLAANNSSTGHFSDLTVASQNTGPCTSSELNLITATFNDPQVDYKYLLATADGGDPSILYTVPVVIGYNNAGVQAGLITSWSLAANVVTFTVNSTAGLSGSGTFTVVIAGLGHGSYLNGTQTILASGFTSTQFKINFTHGNDSATEGGIAGQSISTGAIPNSFTVAVDNTPDPTLVLQQVLLFTDQNGIEYGLALNTPPPAGSLLIKHQGRLWMTGVPGATHSIFFSKAVGELTLPNGYIAGKYEEAWPGDNYFDISDGAESVTGLLSDGSSLYIGSQNHIRRLLGNSPLNFQEPQIVHPQTGVINQEVWQLVYTQGSPAGAIWMTPDFRVIQSDFNTYVDIGKPIQDVLNGLKPTAASLAHASYVADGEYELYILAVPSASSSVCDTHLVYDLRTQKWFVWKPTDGSLSLLFNINANGAPQWLFLDSGSNIFQYTGTVFTDNGTTVTATAKTSWLGLGEPGHRKILNEVDFDGDSATTLTVSGALLQADFLTPLPLATNVSSVLGPLGTRKYFIAGKAIKARYFQFTFQAADSVDVLIGAYNIESIPLTDL